ncbi:RNA polymerase sigma factor [Sphingomonas sp.]|uniref:RNA polymerase sigma factor n=1 Tax=Sphingomonas sp. TaxID=28214 RepID=UPI003D6CB0FF
MVLWTQAMAEPQPSGLAQVFMESRERLLRFLAARGAGEAAEDLLQELWERVSAAPTQPVAAPLGYLYRAAENLMRDRYRADSSRARREQDYVDATDAVIADPGIERALLARERLRAVEAALSALGPRTEQVFRLYRLDGVGQATIARDLGVSLSTVEKDLQRAYRALGALRESDDAE